MLKYYTSYNNNTNNNNNKNNNLFYIPYFSAEYSLLQSIKMFIIIYLMLTYSSFLLYRIYLQKRKLFNLGWMSISSQWCELSCCELRSFELLVPNFWFLLHACDRSHTLHSPTLNPCDDQTSTVYGKLTISS